MRGEERGDGRGGVERRGEEMGGEQRRGEERGGEGRRPSATLCILACATLPHPHTLTISSPQMYAPAPRCMYMSKS